MRANKLEEIEIKLNLSNPKSLNVIGEGMDVQIVSDRPPPLLLSLSSSLPSVQVESLLLPK